MGDKFVAHSCTGSTLLVLGQRGRSPVSAATIPVATTKASIRAWMWAEASLVAVIRIASVTEEYRCLGAFSDVPRKTGRRPGQSLRFVAVGSLRAFRDPVRGRDEIVSIARPRCQREGREPNGAARHG